MKKILFAAIFLLSLGAKAQLIGMSHTPPAIDGDTILSGYTSTDDVWVKNYGSSVMNDDLLIITAVRDSINPSVLDTTDYYFTALPVTINPGDSMLFSLTHIYNASGPGNYRYGIDVIVVWPVALSSGATTGPDSLEYTIYIEPSTGIHELDINEIVRLYPNPSAEKISIEPLGNAQVEMVNIYDMQGRIVLSAKNEACVDVSGLAPGLYTVGITLSDKKHYSLKFLRQKNSPE